MYAGRSTYTVAILLAFTLLVVGSAHRGSSARVCAPAPVAREVASPEQALLLWRELGLRGRTLVYFGRFPHFTLTGPTTSAARR